MTATMVIDTGCLVGNLVITPDGCSVVAVCGGENPVVRAWSLDTGEELRCPGTRTGTTWSMAITTDGRCIVTNGSDDTSVQLRSLEARGGGGGWGGEVGSVRLEGRTHRVLSLTVTPDGQYIVGCDSGGVYVWFVESGRRVRWLYGHGGGVRSVTVTPDSQYVVSGGCTDGTIRVQCLCTGEEVLRLKGHTCTVYSLAITPDGRYLVSTGHGGEVIMWSLEAGEEVMRMEGHDTNVNSVAITPDGRFVVTGSGDKTVRIWSLCTGEEVLCLDGHTAYVQTVAITPDGGRIVSGSWDNTIRVWSVTGELARLEFVMASRALSAVREMLMMTVAVPIEGGVEGEGGGEGEGDEGEYDSRCLPEMVLRCFIVEDAAVIKHRARTGGIK